MDPSNRAIDVGDIQLEPVSWILNIHWPKWRLYIDFKSTYFVDKYIFGVIFFPIEASMQYQLIYVIYWAQIRQCILFYEQSSGERSKWKFQKSVNYHTIFGKNKVLTKWLKEASVTSVTAIVTNASGNTSPHWIYVGIRCHFNTKCDWF